MSFSFRLASALGLALSLSPYVHPRHLTVLLTPQIDADFAETKACQILAGLQFTPEMMVCVLRFLLFLLLLSHTLLLYPPYVLVIYLIASGLYTYHVVELLPIYFIHIATIDRQFEWGLAYACLDCTRLVY